MTALARELEPRPARLRTPALAGMRAESSVGVTRYCARLADAMAELGVDYVPTERSLPGRAVHIHLANSSRLSAFRASRRRPFVVTLHDVRPRTKALEPFYRSVVYPRVVGRSAAAIVHSAYAADLLRRLGARPRRLEVIPHPATRPASIDRTAARAALGLDDDRLVAVLPGVIKSAKLVREAVTACSSVRDDWRLVLAGPVRDHGGAKAARLAGGLVLEHPDDTRYEQAIVAADVVLCLRVGSVGESNGPLLDALGAGRPVLATATGSIPEMAGGAARFVEPTSSAIADGLRALADGAERIERSGAARMRADELSWGAAAVRHAELFAEIFRG